MPPLICDAAKLNDDVIAGLGAKSVPIRIKVEVLLAQACREKYFKCWLKQGSLQHHAVEAVGLFPNAKL